MKNATILLAVVAVLAMAAPAQAVYLQFTNYQGTGLWETTDNWYNETTKVADGPPDAGEMVRLYNQHPTLSATGTCLWLVMGRNGNSSLTVTSAGDLTCDKIYMCETAGKTGSTVDQAGDVTTAGDVTIGVNSPGTYNITGGTLSVGDDVYVYGKGSMFHVAGSAATINITDAYTHNATDAGGLGSTLKIGLDAGAESKTLINVGGSADFGSSGTNSTLDLYLVGAYEPTLGQTFNLMTAQGAMDISDLSWDTATWDVTVVSGSNTLQAEYLVPEPMTLTLLGLGGIGVLLRRRKK